MEMRKTPHNKALQPMSLTLLRAVGTTSELKSLAEGANLVRHLFAILTLVASSASAAEWQPLADFGTVIAEVDVASIKAEGKLVEATFRFTHTSSQTNLESGVGYLSAEVHSLFSCDAHTFAPFSRKEFSGPKGMGSVVATIVIPESKRQFSSITPGSMNEFMFQSVCAHNATK